MVKTKAGNGRLASDLLWAHITWVEAFPKGQIDAVNSQISSIDGIGSIGAAGTSNLNLASDQGWTWKADRLDALLAAVSRTAANWGGSTDFLHRMIVGLEVDSLSSDALPFYLVAFRATLNKDAVADSPNLARDLGYVRNSLSVFIENLKGDSTKGYSFSPCVPSITALAAYVDEKDFTRLRDKVRKLVSGNLSSSGLKALGDEHRDLEPFNFDPTSQKDMKSHVPLEPNVSLVLGNANPIVFLRSPYMVIISPTKGLLEPEPFMMSLTPYATNARLDMIWFLPNVFIVPLASFSWLGRSWKEIGELRGRLASVGQSASSSSSKSMSTQLLDGLTNAGLALSMIDIGLELLERGFGRTLDGWANNSIPGQTEIRIPSGKHWHSSRDPKELEEGYLAALGGWLRRDLDTMRDNVESLEREVRLLSDHINQAEMRRSTLATEESTKAMRESSKAMEESTKTLLTSQSSIEYLTWVLIGLTGLLVAIGVFQVDLGPYSFIVLPAIFSLIAIILEQRLVAAISFSVSVALVVAFIVAETWPDCSVFVGLVLVVVSGIVSFMLLQLYFQRAAKHKEL